MIFRMKFWVDKDSKNPLYTVDLELANALEPELKKILDARCPLFLRGCIDYHRRLGRVLRDLVPLVDPSLQRGLKELATHVCTARYMERFSFEIREALVDSE